MTTQPPLLPGLTPGLPIDLTGDLGFRPGRVHEICGPARRVLGAWLAGRLGGPVVWAQPRHGQDILCPEGLARFCDPGQLLRVTAETPTDLLWVMEEVLRSGAARLVVAELAAPPGLTPVRRLQLAAEAGPGQPLGLMLTPERGGAPGVESRWHLQATAGGGWRAERLRARLAPELSLELEMTAAGLESRRSPTAAGDSAIGRPSPPHS